ncbi:MAG: hypothetical protein F4X83_06070 [Chloroflexi bacterium]|nr:hypothetical protein [Chloroflexota bacterium]
MPEGKAPHEVLREGNGAWQECIATAVPLVAYAFRMIARQHDLSSMQGKRRAVEALAPLITDIGDPVARQQYLKRLAQVLDLGIQSEVLMNLMHARRPTRRTAAPMRQNGGEQPSANGQEHAVDGLEQYLLGLLIVHPEARGLAAEVIDAEDFHQPLYRQAYEYVRAVEGNGAASVEESEEESVHALLDRLRRERSIEPPIDEEYLRPTVIAAALRLKRRNVQEEYEDLQLLLASERTTDNKPLGSQIRQEIRRIGEQLRQVNRALKQTSFIRTS